MWLPVLYVITTHSPSKQNVLYFYLLIIITKAIIKAIAIIDTATRAEKSKIINCNNISTICTTSLSYVSWDGNHTLLFLTSLSIVTLNLIKVNIF